MFLRLFLYFLTVIAILIVGTAAIWICCGALGVPLSGRDLAVSVVSMSVLGIGGSLVGLFSSKAMVTKSMHVQVIREPANEGEKWLVGTIANLAEKKGVKMPDVGIYDSPDMNAFATGWNRDAALVAVSTGLLQNMSTRQVEAVLGHEMSHVDNGDMVTMSLIQGVVNTFVLVLSSVVATVLSALISNSDDRRGRGIGGRMLDNTLFYVMQLLFGFLGTMVVMWFSRWREYRADAGSAEVLGSENMISALEALKGNGRTNPSDSRTVNALCISAADIGSLFMSHPPLDDRIRALRKLGR